MLYFLIPIQLPNHSSSMIKIPFLIPSLCHLFVALQSLALPIALDNFSKMLISTPLLSWLGSVLICHGDFNIHIDDTSDTFLLWFFDFLDITDLHLHKTLTVQQYDHLSYNLLPTKMSVLFWSHWYLVARHTTLLNPSLHKVTITALPK